MRTCVVGESNIELFRCYLVKRSPLETIQRAGMEPMEVRKQLHIGDAYAEAMGA